jgi:hypothetical protein
LTFFSEKLASIYAVGHIIITNDKAGILIDKILQGDIAIHDDRICIRPENPIVFF